MAGEFPTKDSTTMAFTKQGDRRMANKRYGSITVGFSDSTAEVDAQREINNFLLALHSYPERFADDPGLTFEEYLFSIMVSEQALNGGPHRVH
jgi:hypothetical protein